MNRAVELVPGLNMCMCFVVVFAIVSMYRNNRRKTPGVKTQVQSVLIEKRSKLPKQRGTS